jgi:hypothetical protein
MRSKKMAARKLRVLVLYGGDAATRPRNELISWMVEKKALNVEPVQVAWGTAHSEGSVADRVKKEIDLADKAIAIVTKDTRSTHGAPNISEEIGRWLQAKGGRTLCVIRQEGTQINSNAAGLIYLSFESRIREVFDDLRDFLADDASAADPSAPSSAAGPTVTPSSTITVASNPNWILVGQRAYPKVRVDETPEAVTAVVACAEPADESAIRRLSRRAEIEVVYGNHVAQGAVSESRISHEVRSIGTVVVSVQDRHQQRGFGRDMSFGGPNGMSADEIAEQRARRLLIDEPRARKNDMYGPEMLIRGVGDAIQVTESPISKLLVGRSRDERATWERVRLELVRLLIVTNCVEHIDLLSLQVTNGKLVHIDFRGTRHVSSGYEPVVIEINADVSF